MKIPLAPAYKRRITMANKAIAGTGFQMFPEVGRVRIENEDGDFVAFSRHFDSAMRRFVPNGAGGKTREQLVQKFR